MNEIKINVSFYSKKKKNKNIYLKIFLIFIKFLKLNTDSKAQKV